MVAAYHLYVGVDYSSSTEVEVRRRCFGGDAEEVAKLLARGRSDCRILRGPVSDSHLVNAIAEAVGQNRKGQNVLIYFAGHAIRRHSTTHLLASSGSRDDAAGVDTHWILRLINGAQHLRSAAIVLDCCHSGCPDSLERDRFWLGATSVDATVDDEFHGLLVQCLAEHKLRALDLATLHMWIVERLGSPMPELAAWYSAPFVLLPQPAASVTSDFSEWWTSAAAISLAERGRLRTAFPLDLSFSELHRDELYIPPRARRLGTSGT